VNDAVISDNQASPDACREYYKALNDEAQKLHANKVHRLPQPYSLIFYADNVGTFLVKIQLLK